MGAKTSAQAAALQGDGLPEGWNVIRFGQIAQIANGQVDPRAAPYRSMVHVGPENIESGTGHIRAKRTAGELGMISGKYLFDEHAIVYSKVRPNLNKACIPGFRGVCSADAYPIWVQDSAVVERNFLFHYMLSELFLRQTVAASLRTGMPKINRPDLASVRVVLPPREEQQAIAAFLDNMDRACALIRGVIPRKRRRLRGLMQQLLTGRRRLPAFAAQPTRTDRVLGMMPADWEAVPLRRIVKKVTRRNTVGETHVLTASGEFGLVDQREFFNRSVAGADLSGYYLLKRGEFAYNRSRMKGYRYGAIKRLDRYPQGALSTLYLCFGIASDDVDSDFLRWYFEGGQMGRQLGRVTPVGGRAHGLLNITDDDFYSIKIMLPPIDEQRAIADVLDTAQKEIDLLVALREQIQQQKRGLMQKLLTGQIRVSAPACAGGATDDRL